MARKNKKKVRFKKYNGKFFGITKDALVHFRRDIPDDFKRGKTLLLLLYMLILGNWDYYAPDKPFKCPYSLLNSQLGWSSATISKYMKVLLDIGAIKINFHGGPFKKANLYILNISYMGILN